MTGLQLNVGLISGINYVELVDQLLRIDAIPRDTLAARTERLAAERDALTNLMAVFLTSSYMIRRLNNVTPFRMTEVASSNENLIRATRTGTPVVGSYTFTPLQTASSQQTVAQGVASDTEALGKTGTITIGKGWTVESEVQLKDLNGGQGIAKGSIRLTDGNGIRANIDLRNAMTIKDVVNAINDNHDVDVIAELDGDRIVLRDVSGGDPSKMMVQEVSGGTTAASLGLIGDNVINDNGVIRGNIIWRLGESMSLSLLNDGNGLVFDDVFQDITVYTRDGSTVNIDFWRLTTEEERLAGAPVNIRELTVGDLLNTINNSTDVNGNAGKVSARISDDGKSIVIQDNTVGNGYTSLTQIGTPNPVLQMFGLADTSMNTSVDMFSDLLGRITPANPAKIEFTDKAGNSAVIELTERDIRDMQMHAQTARAIPGNFGYATTMIASMLNQKLEAAGVEIELRTNSTYDGIDIIDKSIGTGSTTITDQVFDVGARLGLTNATLTDVDIISAITASEPGKIRFTDREGEYAVIEITQADIDAITDEASVVALFNDKLAAENPALGMVVELNAAGDGLVIRDTTTGTGTMSVVRQPLKDVFTTGNRACNNLELKLAEDFADNAVPGEIVFQDRDGNTTTIDITGADIAALGAYDMENLAILLNARLAGGTHGIAGAADIAIQVNKAGDGLEVVDNTTTTANWFTLNIEDETGLFAAPREVYHWALHNVDFTAEPGMTRIRDLNGRGVTLELSQDELDDLAAMTLEEQAEFFNGKIDGAIDVEFRVNNAGDGLILVDTTSDGGTLTLISVERIDPSNVQNSVVARLGIGGTTSDDTIEGTAFGSMMHGKAIQSGTFQTRNLLGGLDTVLTSTLNGGYGLAGTGGTAFSTPGTVEVQDRSGKTALLDFSYADLKSIQTLSDAVKLYNAKLSDAGIGITVRINDTKTGLQLVDMTGSTSHNMIFRDVVGDYTIPGIPAVEAVDAVSGGVGGVAAVSGGQALGGTAALNFGNTNWLNNFTFGFTTDDTVPVYDSASPRTLTFYLDEDALNDPALTDEERDLMVKDAINAQIAAHWATIAADEGWATEFPLSHGMIQPPTIQTWAGLADAALHDADNDLQTAINLSNGTYGRQAGTASLTFEGTDLMDLFTFGFTTEGTGPSYNFADQRFTFHLSQEILDETDPDERDRLVKEAIDAQMKEMWDEMPSWIRQFDTPEVKLTEGMGAKAIYDAEHGLQTKIDASLEGSTFGVVYVPAVDPITITGGDNPRIASNFGLNVNAAISSVSGTTLNRQVISYNTPLSELNGGAGVIVEGGRIVITDSRMINNPNTTVGGQIPNSQTLVLDPERHKTVGDIINAINRLTQVNVFASINETGDGIVIEDRTVTGSTGTFSIRDADTNSKFAESLGIAGAVTQTQKAAAGGVAKITHSETHRIEVEATDSLQDIRDKINALNANYSASIIADGSHAPYRLSVSGKTTGAAGAFHIDLSALGLTTDTMSEAKDAKIAYGDASMGNSLILSSSTNTFKNIVDGIDLTITGVSNTPVTVNCASSSTDVKVTLQTFVENYNRYREYLNTQMNYIITPSGQIQVAEEGGMLWNSSVAKAFDRDINRMLLQVVEGIPGVRTLADLGITMRSNLEDEASNKETGKLYFDEDKFQAAWDRDHEAVQKFFFDQREHVDSSGNVTTVNTGWAQKFSDVVDSLVGSSNGEVTGSAQSRIDTLSITIDRNDQRVAYLEERLEFKRQMYLKQFYAMEQAMARMTSDMNAVGNIASSWSSNYASGS